MEKYTKLKLLLMVVISFSFNCIFGQKHSMDEGDDFLGTWAGTILRRSPDSSVVMGEPIIIRFHKFYSVNQFTSKIEMSQIVNYNKPNTQRLIKRITVFGMPTYLSLKLDFNDGSEYGNNRKIDIELNKKGINDELFIEGIYTPYGDMNYLYNNNLVFSLKKINSDTTDFELNKLTKSTSKISSITKTTDLKNGIYSYTNVLEGSNEKENFKIYIRNATSKGADFHFFADQEMCNIEFQGKLNKKNDLYIYSNSNKSNSFSLKFKDSKVIIKNISCVIDECALCPREGTYSYSGEIEPESKSLKVLSGGATTPEELGRILLKALKTNNKALWESYAHPERPVEFIGQRFSDLRMIFEEYGLSNWNLVSFNRVTFLKKSTANEKEQVRNNFNVEFNYKNGEFIGVFGNMTIGTFQNGSKFYIWFPGFPGRDAILGLKK